MVNITLNGTRRILSEGVFCQHSNSTRSNGNGQIVKSQIKNEKRAGDRIEKHNDVCAGFVETHQRRRVENKQIPSMTERSID